MTGRPPLPIGLHGDIWTGPDGRGGFIARARHRDPDGETRQLQRTGRTEKGARNNLLQALNQRRGRALLTAESRFTEAADLWLAGIEAAVDAGDLSPNTLRQYGLQLDNQIRPKIGKLRLREVTTQRVDELLSSIRTGSGAATAKMCRTVLSGVMGLAARYDAVTGNPVREAARVTSRRRTPPRSLTADERQRWLAQLEADKRAVRKDLPDLTRWMLATGVRIGEALAVSWDELLLERPTVLIAYNLIRITGQGLVRVSYVKSPAGIRELPLPAFAVEMLLRRGDDRGRSGPVFPNTVGGWRDPSNTARDVRDARGTEGFRWVTSHVFRKTCATILDEEGLTARVIADQLGHSKPSMTQDVYMGRKAVDPATAAALDRQLRSS